jgi:hypothetical protein
VNQIAGLSSQEQANEIRLWIRPIVTCLIGLGLVLGIKNRWWKSNIVRKENNMIYPSRPFSITGISMDGFDPVKTYPVLAINMDQYLAEETQNDDKESSEPPVSQTIAFFLVGDDQGAFAWIAEVECKLASL